MITIYRLVQSAFKEDISGQGVFLYGGRWNSKGMSALYTSENISLAALEIVVNYDRNSYPLLPDYYLLEIEVPEQSMVQIKSTVLKIKWQEDVEYTRFMGDQFLKQRTHLVLKMPSAVIQEEFNLLLNPLHTDFERVHIKSSRKYGLDNRLFGGS